ncbi:MAG TPA: hypothetical protein PK636_06095 [bacterium]|nr:hypothetical protein [bacterium]HPJ72234.1 hypothetical protein [bacterium]HPQ65468.1 hypothetical protein [bacterium]
MRVSIELRGPLRAPEGGKNLSLELPSGVTVQEALAKSLKYPPEQIRHLLVTRDGESLPLSRKLLEDSRIQVFLRLGGG